MRKTKLFGILMLFFWLNAYAQDQASLTDSDNDGVFDDVDLDDDNDGILDDVEWPDFFSTDNSVTDNYIFFTPSDLGYNSRPYGAANPILNDSHDISASFNLPAGSVILTIVEGYTHANGSDKWACSNTANTTFKVTSIYPFKIIPFHGRALQPGETEGFRDLSTPVSTYAYIGDASVLSTPQPPPGIGAADAPFYTYPTYGNGIDQVISGNDYGFTNTGTYNAPLGNFGFTGIPKQDLTYKITGYTYNATVEYYTTVTVINQGMDLYINVSPDIDRDGVPDFLDLDSDGDGCLDIVEAGVQDYIGAFDLGNITTSGSVTNGNGVDATQNVTNTLDNAMLNTDNGGDTQGGSANGFHDALEMFNAGEFDGAPYDLTYYSNPNTLHPSCACYDIPGTSSAVVTNVGISTLNRLKTSEEAQWLSQINSAYLVLDSKDKGFVLPRLNSTEIGAITTPKVGMVVYDTDAKCLKLYDQIGWTCISQTCNN